MERSYPGPGRPRGRPSALPAAVAQPCRHAPSPRDPAASSPPARTARARKTRLQSCSEVDLHHRQTDPRDLESRTGIRFRRFAALTQPHNQLARGGVVPATFAAWMVVLCRVGAALPRPLSLGRLVWGVGGAICAAELHWRGKGPPPTRQSTTMRAARPRRSPTVAVASGKPTRSGYPSGSLEESGDTASEILNLRVNGLSHGSTPHGLAAELGNYA